MYRPIGRFLAVWQDVARKGLVMEWDAGAIMDICIGIFFLLFGAGLLYMFIRLGSVLTRVTGILKDVNQEVTPLLTRVETTLDGVNSELEKVDEITGSVATMVKTAETATTAAESAVTKPIKRVAGLASAAQRALNSLFSKEGSV